MSSVAVTVVALVLVSPVLVKVYGRLGDTVRLGLWWLAAIAALVVVHFVCTWELYRVVLRTSRRFDIAASQLVANAASHVAPAGSAVGAGIQLRMLTTAGFPATQAVTALGATTLLGTMACYIVLPLVVLIASVAGGGIEPRLVRAMWFGAAVLTALLAGVVILAARDGPWRRVARVVSSTRRRLRRDARDTDELADRLIQNRDLIRTALRARAGYVVLIVLLQPLADYSALYLALRAVGAHINPAAALAAFIVANLAGLIPLTPGGLGFVEAGLTAILTIAGTTRHDAHLAVLTYRLAATWLPCIAGLIALIWFQHRHRNHTHTKLIAQ